MSIPGPGIDIIFHHTPMAKLITYNRGVVVANGHIMTRNGPTIGVWWKHMSISGQISHLQYVCNCDKWSYYEKKLTYNRCVVEIKVHSLPN